MAAGKGVMHIQWYATIFRGSMFADAVAEFAGPEALRYGATRFSVQRSRDDAYKIVQQMWFNSSDDWYRYWEGPEMREFRGRYAGKYQVPIVYTWHDEHGAGSVDVDAVTPEDASATSADHASAPAA